MGSDRKTPKEVASGSESEPGQQPVDSSTPSSSSSTTEQGSQEKRVCEFYDADPLIKLIMRNPRFGPGFVFAVSVLVYLVVPTVWSFIDGTLMTRDVAGTTVYGFLQPINVNILVLPLLYAVIINYYRNSAGIILRLENRGILVAIAREASSTRTPRRWWTRAWWKAGYWHHSRLGEVVRRIPAALFILACAGLATYTINSGYSRNDQNWMFSGTATRVLGYYFLIMFNGLGVYLMVGWALNHFRLARMLHKAFGSKSRYEIHLNTLHPDGFMGLAPVSETSQSAAVVLLVVSFWMFTWQIGAYVGAQHLNQGFLREMFRIFEVGAADHLREGARGLAWLGSWVVYLALAPAAFFAPLSAVRQAMWTQKESDLASLSTKIIGINNYDIMKGHYEHYHTMAKVRVWPFNAETMISFALSFLSPLVLTVTAEMIISWLTG